MRSSRRRDHRRDLVGFTVAELSYAISIDVVREIIRPLPIVDVPHAPPTIIGVADHREAVIPIIDLRKLFGREPAEPSRRTKWVIVSSSRTRSVGLVVDSVTDVFGVSKRATRSVPAWAEAQRQAGMGEVVSRQGELVFVLNPDAVIRPALQAQSLLAGLTPGRLPSLSEGPHE